MVKKRTPVVLTKDNQESLSFGFDELSDVSYVKASNDSDFFVSFLQRLKKYCQLSWSGIRTAQRHGFGTESIDVGSLNEGARSRVPSQLKKLLVLRITGDNHTFLGYRKGNTFQVLSFENILLRNARYWAFLVNNSFFRQNKG